MNVDDSGFDSDTKFGGDKKLKKFALQNSESWGLKALEDSSELFPPADGVNGDIESSEHSLQTFPEVEYRSGGSSDASARKKRSRSSTLQQKLENQIEAAHRRSENGTILQQPRKGFFSTSRNGGKQGDASLLAEQQPLVAIEAEESEDEFAVPRLSRETQREITRQLIKDGYNLDLEPDDEDLDLILPKPMVDRCACCQVVQCSQQ